eukprot:12412097-Karenia_brevis.AAC.1
MTKHLAQAELHKYFEYINLSREYERPKAAAELSQVEAKREESAERRVSENVVTRSSGGNALIPWWWHSRLNHPFDRLQLTYAPGEHSWSQGRRRQHTQPWQWLRR